MVELTAIKEYLRIDNAIDDVMLDNHSLVAEAYVKGAVDGYEANIKNADFKAIAEQVQLAYIAELYENRLQYSGNKTPSFMVQSMLLQLQTYPKVVV